MVIRLEMGPGRVGPLRLLADGVVLNPGLPDEPYASTLLALGRTLAKLGSGPQALNLARARLLWVIHAEEGEAVLRWVHRGRPRSSVVRQTRVDLAELAEAVARALDPVPRTTALRKRLRHLHPVAPPGVDAGDRVFAVSAGQLQLNAALTALPHPQGTPWHRLLAPGRIDLQLVQASVGSLREPPFLGAGDLVRWAQRAAKPGRGEPLVLDGGTPLHIDRDDVLVGPHRLAGSRWPLLDALAQLTQQILSALADGPGARALSTFEPFQTLSHQTAALAAVVRQRTLPAPPDARAPQPAKPSKPIKPIARGSVRKLAFERRFETRLPFSTTSLHLHGDDTLALGPEGVARLDARGQRMWTRRVQAVCSGPLLWAVDGERLMGLDPRSGDCRWFRDGEGTSPIRLTQVLPELVLLEEVDALSGRHPDTGFPRWHFRPPMDERVFATCVDDRIYAATAGGRLDALDAQTGEPRFRAMAGRPFTRAPVRHGDGLLLTQDGDSGDVLLFVSAVAAEVRWRRPLEVRAASAPVAIDDVIACVGRTGDGWVLVVLDAGSERMRHVPTGFAGRRRPHLAGTARGFLVGTDDGQALLFDTSGAPRFSHREPAPPSAAPVWPLLQRQLAIVASERPKVFDLTDGRTLATLPRLEELSAMAASPELRVVLASVAGTVRGYLLRGHLAVAPEPD